MKNKSTLSKLFVSIAATVIFSASVQATVYDKDKQDVVITKISSSASASSVTFNRPWYQYGAVASWSADAYCKEMGYSTLIDHTYYFGISESGWYAEYFEGSGWELSNQYGQVAPLIDTVTCQ